MKLDKYLLLLAAAFLATACGGGGGNASAPSTDAAATKNVGSVVFNLDKTTINTAGADKALLTITVLDSSRNALGGVPVKVVVDSGSYTPVSATTDDSGQASGYVSAGGDNTNRSITASISATGTSGAVSTSATVIVNGGKIELTLSPATPQPGQVVTAVIGTTDSAGNALANIPVQLSGNAGLSGQVTTDIGGKKTVTFSAPGSANTYSVTASALGTTTSKNIQVFAPQGTGIPDAAAISTLSSLTLSVSPSTIAPNAAGTETNRAKLSAKFINSDNKGVSNLRVRFFIVKPGLDNGEKISTSTNTVYSDTSGVAESEYISGTRTSPTNGVKVAACVKSTEFVPADFDADGQCVTSASVVLINGTLTVAAAPISVSIGDNNLLATSGGGIAYLKQFLIQVNDSAGVAAAGVVVTASVDITHYAKGKFNLNPTPPAVDVKNPSSNVSAGYINSGTSPNITYTTTTGDSSAPALTSTGEVASNVWCRNEDINRNGFLDVGEDINGDIAVTPRKADIIVSYVNGNKTDSNGQVLVQVTYPQNVGKWLYYTLRATSSVLGSEGDASRSFVTDVLQGDVANGSFLKPPYGSGACNANK